MKFSIRIPLWVSIIGYLLFFVMIVGFTVFLPWIVPVSLIIGAFLIGLIAWGIHKRVMNLLMFIVTVLVAFIFFFLASKGFVLFVETNVLGKIFLIAGISGLAIIFLGRENREIREFERFIGFESPLKGLRKNSKYVAGTFFDFRSVWSKIYHPSPKSKLRVKKKKFFQR